MSSSLRSTWHQPEHRLWDDFVKAMRGGYTLSEFDWQSYLEVHDKDELKPFQAEIDAIKDLLDPPMGTTGPLPPKKKRVRKKS